MEKDIINELDADSALLSNNGIKSRPKKKAKLLKRPIILISIGILTICVLSFIIYFVHNGLAGADLVVPKKMALKIDISMEEEDLVNSEMIEIGQNTTIDLLTRFNSPQFWKFWFTNDQNETFYTGRGTLKKGYKLSARMPGSPREMLKILVDGFEESQDWSRDVQESKILNRIDNQTHIVYQKTVAVWPLAPRDFVSLCHSEELIDGQEFVLGCNAIDWDLESPSDAVRGYVNTSGTWIRRDEDNPGWTKLEQIFDINFSLAFFPFRDTMIIMALEGSIEDFRNKLLKQTHIHNT